MHNTIILNNILYSFKNNFYIDINIIFISITILTLLTLNLLSLFLNYQTHIRYRKSIIYFYLFISILCYITLPLHELYNYSFAIYTIKNLTSWELLTQLYITFHVFLTTNQIVTPLFTYSDATLLWSSIIILFTFFYISIIITFDNKTSSKYSNEFFNFIILIMFGVIMIIVSNNLLLIELNFSLITFSTIGLIKTYHTNSKLKTSKNLDQTILSFYTNSVYSSILFIIATALVYYYFKTLNITLIQLIIINPNFSSIWIKTELDMYLMIFTIILFFISFSFKLNIMPFTKWIFSFYNNLSTIILTYITTIPKIGYTLFIYNFLIKCLHSYNSNLTWIILLISIPTIISSIGGLQENKIKRILAFSSIFHGGLLYLLIITDSASTMLTYSVLYHLVMFTIWLGILISEYSYISIKTKLKLPKTIDITTFILENLITKNKTLTILLGILFFILTGLPPFIYFIIKFISLYSLFTSSNLYFVIIILILISFYTLFFYYKLLIPLWNTKKLNNTTINLFYLNKKIIRLYTLITLIVISLHIINFESIIIFIDSLTNL